MKTRPGEALIDCLDSIEDTKGNNGERGPFNTNDVDLLCVTAQLNNKNIVCLCRTTFGNKSENHLALFVPAKSQLV